MKESRFRLHCAEYGSRINNARILFKFFLACSDFCRLPIALANRLNPDQDRQKVAPDLDPNRLTL